MKFSDILEKAKKEKYTDGYNDIKIDFENIKEEITDIDQYRFIISSSDHSTLKHIIVDSNDILAFSLINYDTHPEIVAKEFELQKKDYKRIINLYNNFSDEEKLKFEIED